jgi:hypothetical protein
VRNIRSGLKKGARGLPRKLGVLLMLAIIGVIGRLIADWHSGRGNKVQDIPLMTLVFVSGALFMYLIELAVIRIYGRLKNRLKS